MALEATVRGAWLDTILKDIQEFVSGNMALRQRQSGNAPLAQGFQQGTAAGTGDTAPISDTAITVFRAAQSGATKFAYMVCVLEDSAAECRYTQDASEPTAAGRGTQAPATGTGFTITIQGAENVKNFKIIAMTGGTAPYTMQGFV